jgi:PIN domain nuclease of toxin-antitoxin system
VKLLLDTHVLLWNAQEPHRLSRKCFGLINDPRSEIFFSAVSIWEIAIKQALGKPDFSARAEVVRGALLENLFREVPVNSLHGIAFGALPLIHADPFDRILIAQAIVEGLTLITSDEMVAQYPGPILRV